ncbi:MAG TPA: AMP-binding protein [Vicinamibacterales bacterium]|nr:AMP-binding protein [Vicinamibacterales bacterium]
MTETAFVDRFVLDRLPARGLWPQLDWSSLSELNYPARLNCTAALLDSWIEAGQGDCPAFHHAGGVWSYRRVFETANRIADVLVDELGLVPGGRVLLRAPNHPMLVACWFAVLRAGGVAVTTMPLLRQRELTEILERADVRLALCDARVAADLQAAVAGRPDMRILHFNSDAPDSLDSRAADLPPAFTAVSTAATDPAIIAFTSGTTGRAKATVHFHRDILAVTDTYARHVLKPTPDDIFIGTPPLAFTYALGGLVLFPMRFGASTALLEQATPPHLLEGIQQYRATVTVTSPTAYRAMLQQAGQFDLTSLRRCISAGETLPAAVFDAWEKATGIRVMDGIGSTELLHMFIGSPPDEAKPGSTGRVVPGYQARVIDEAGVEVPRRTVGRLAVYGPTGCRYLDDPENQQKYVQGGWNLTGDAYVQDEDGYFWYQSRTDDMIISSGYNIAGAEVENVLLTHPAVAECAVVGVPDEARGHIVKAVIVPAAGVTVSDQLARTLQEYVKSEIAPYKYPRAIQFVESLPRTLTGKIQRFRLRQDHAAATAAGEARPPASPPAVHVHEPDGWARPIGYANAASATGRTVFVSGQVGWDPATAQFASNRFPDQVHQALANVVAALAAAGARPDQIARLTWYVTDRDLYLGHRKEIGESYRALVGRHFPAMSVVVVAGLIEPGALVEIEATAVVEGPG